MAVIESEIAAHRWVAIDPALTLAGLPLVSRRSPTMPDAISLSGQIGQSWPTWTAASLAELGPSEPIARKAEEPAASAGPGPVRACVELKRVAGAPGRSSGREPRRIPDADIIAIGRAGDPIGPEAVLASRAALPRLDRPLPRRFSMAGLTAAQRLLCLMLATAIVGGAIYVTTQAMRPHVIYVPATVSDRSAIV